MKYLNYFSLKKKLRLPDTKKIPLDNAKKNVKFKVFFIVKDEIVFKNNNILFYETDDLTSTFLMKEELSLVAKKEKEVYVSCNLSLRRLRNRKIFYSIVLVNIRNTLFSLDNNLAAIIASGYQLIQWKKNNIFCGKCGSKNIFFLSENTLVCQKDACKTRHFPRINPTVIMNITYKKKILLARNCNWKENLYSCLAGFCELNESAEEAVERETFEETGIHIKKINYIFSQSWPFQNNLMLGFEAEATKPDLIINKQEIEDARWFSYNELISFVNEKKLILPAKYSIARNLIYLWEKKITKDS